MFTCVFLFVFFSGLFCSTSPVAKYIHLTFILASCIDRHYFYTYISLSSQQAEHLQPHVQVVHVSFRSQDVTPILECPSDGRPRPLGTDVSFQWYHNLGPVGGQYICRQFRCHPKWQVEAILSATHDEPQPQTLDRSDLPVAYSGRRANFSLAVAAGQPNNRKRSLEQLDADVLARSTNPANEARLRTYLAICAVWEVSPWPLTIENTRAFGASLKMGGYRSAGVYFQSICSFQQRVLHTPVPQMVRYCIKDCIRSIKRGLGVTRLKDGFPALGLALINISNEVVPFDIHQLEHARDMAVLATWFMLREIEMAAARAAHLRVDAHETFILIPTYKTDTFGKLTERSLKCTCRIQSHPMCPFHAAVRHLSRLGTSRGSADPHQFPLFPDNDGTTPTKATMVQVIRSVISATGQSLERPDANGRPLQRFGGHSLRVAGAQLLAASGIPLQTQEAALAVVPDVSEQVLRGRDLFSMLHGLEIPMSTPTSHSAPTADHADPSLCDQEPFLELKAASDRQQAQVQKIQTDLRRLQSAVTKPQFAFVKRVRSAVVHIGSTVELSNPHSRWRSKCGWMYGTSNFLRVAEIVTPLRKCKKCFEMGEGSDTEGSSDSDGSAISDSSSSSDS